jgi:hypothetical protein
MAFAAGGARRSFELTHQVGVPPPSRRWTDATAHVQPSGLYFIGVLLVPDSPSRPLYVALLPVGLSATAAFQVAGSPGW